jgi:hypothetical protein
MKALLRVPAFAFIALFIVSAAGCSESCSDDNKKCCVNNTINFQKGTCKDQCGPTETQKPDDKC